MNESFLINQLRVLKPVGTRLYLVGGAVRDILRQKPGRDFDLVCDFDTRIIARAFADQQKGAYYPLDAGRNTSRVILFEKDGRKVFYDFARLQGGSIENDLAVRDFTINAMALDLDAPDQIIDPLGGALDLKQKILRSCSETTFSDDPVRTIRAVRYAIALNLSMVPTTLSALKSAVLLLEQISKERNRDELLKVLDTGKPDVGLQLLARLGILEALKIGIPQGDISTVARHCGALETLFGELEGIGSKESAQSLPLSSFLLRLGRFRETIIPYLHKVNGSGRTLRTMDLLGALLNHYERADFLKALEVLSLSNDEKFHLSVMYESQYILKTMSGVPDRRQIYRFFKNAPLDVCFIWLAELLSQPSAERSDLTWLSELEKCESLVQAWAVQPEIISPQPLLNGNDLMQIFQLPPGRQVGELLDALIEEQAAGAVTSRSEAIEWIKARLEIS